MNKRIKLWTPFLVLFLITAAVTACDDDNPVNNPPSETTSDLVDVISDQSDLSTLLSLVTDEVATLLTEEEWTVFAPTNAAFEAIPDDVLSSLTEEQVVSILSYHLVEGTTLSSAIPEQADLISHQGEALLIQSNDGVTLNGNSEVVVHKIDSVLLPSAIRKALDMPNMVDLAEDAGSFTTLLDAAEQTGLTTTLQFLSPFTLFAPTDDAFAELPDGTLASLTEEELRTILLYHVLGSEVASTDLQATQNVASMTEEELYIVSNDDGVTVNGSSSVVSADLDASNGIIHAVDEVLMPNQLLNVVQIAQKRYDLTALVDLVVQQDLAGTLSGDGPFTIFAPNNAAFDAASDALDGMNSDEVTETLTYHVVDSEILSGDIADGTSNVTTLQGEDLTVVKNEDGVTINGAAVLSVDLQGTNGVIHLIEDVLVPPTE
ncbi:MAG: fasciclin domain-containing protein [Bacteroidota bacterium]